MQHTSCFKIWAFLELTRMDPEHARKGCRGFFIYCAFGVCICACVHVSAHHMCRSEDSLTCQLLIPTLFETGLFAVSCQIHTTPSGACTSEESPVSASDLCIGVWGGQMCAITSIFSWVLGIQPQLLTLAWPGLCLMSNLFWHGKTNSNHSKRHVLPTWSQFLVLLLYPTTPALCLGVLCGMACACASSIVWSFLILYNHWVSLFTPLSKLIHFISLLVSKCLAAITDKTFWKSLCPRMGKSLDRWGRWVWSEGIYILPLTDIEKNYCPLPSISHI